MPDDLALRAYRREVENLRNNALRSSADVRHQLGLIDEWLTGGSPTGLRNLGADVAALVEAAAALKALQDAAYLTEESP